MEKQVLRKGRLFSFVGGISKYEFALSVLVMVIAFFVFFMDGLNEITYFVPEFDDGYNATVAANFARYGEYKVSYPKDITFYNIITTGSPMLLPAAILYKIFGISEITTGIVPLVYSSLSLVLVFVLLCNCWGNVKGRYAVSALLTLTFFFSKSWLDYVAKFLQGEAASAFFLLLALLFLQLFYTGKKRLFLFLAGFFVPPAFLTKTAMIFFVVVFSGLIFLDGFFLKQIKKRNVADYHLGFLLGFVFFDFFKLITLGGFKPYGQWWVNEVKNMLNQSSGIDFTYSFGMKFSYLKDILWHNNYFCLFLMTLPVLVYFFYVAQCLLRKKEVDEKFSVIRFAGLGGASLLWYFLFFGGRGLIYARRHSVNAMFIKLAFVWFLGFLIFMVLKLNRERQFSPQKKVFSAVLIISLFYLFVPFGRFKSMASKFIDKENSEPELMQLTKGFINKVSLLPENAELYCYSWWQEPIVTLYLDRVIFDISEGMKAENQGESYFIVGRLIHGITKKELEQKLGKKLVKIDGVDFTKYANPYYSVEDLDLCSIYKIEQLD